jgi:hypothetical protein
LDDSSLILSRGQKFFSSTPCPDWLWGIPSLLSKGYSPDLTPCDFWALPTMKRELQGKKFQSDQWSAAHFQEVGRML